MRTVKREWVGVALVLLLVGVAVLAAACGGSSSTTTSAVQTTTPGETTASTEPTTGTSGGGGEPIKIGVIASLTGPAAAPVESVMNSLKLEADRVNAAGGVNGRQLELIVEDDGSVVDKAIAAATKLIKQDNVTVLLGPFPPYELPAVRQIAEDAQVPEIIYQPPSLDQLATPYKWSFTNQQSVVYNGSAAVQIMTESGYKSVVVVHDTLPTFVESSQMVMEFGAKAGLKVTEAPDTWDDGTADVTPVVTKIAAFIKKENPDAVYLACNVPSFAPVMKTLRSLGVTQPVVGAPPVGIGATFSQGPEAVEGVAFASVLLVDPTQGPDSWAGKAVDVDLAERYMAKYNKPTDFFAGFGADTISILVEGLKVGGDDKAKIRDAIESISGLVAANGTYTYSPTDHLGVHDGYFWWKVEGGKYVFVKQLDPEAAR